MEQVYHENTIEKWTKGCIPQFREKGDISIRNNYGGVTFTTIADNIYNAMLLNCIRPETPNIVPPRQHTNVVFFQIVVPSVFVYTFIT